MDENKIKEFFGERTFIPSWKFKDAEKYIKAGLEYFCGEDYKWLPEYDKIARWLSDNQSKGLLLCGDIGTGKTIMATKILCPLIKWKLDHFNLPVFDAYHMKDAFEFAGSMVIDDIGIESFSNNYGQVIDYFTRIIYDAEANNWLLILTSNMAPEIIKKKYGDRTWDRLKRLVRPVVVNDESMRK